MKLRLDLRLSQKLIMTPQLQQAIKLLQLSRLELQQSLAQHLMENPLVDELPEEVRNSVRFHPVKTMDEVLAIAMRGDSLRKAAERREARLSRRAARPA